MGISQTVIHSLENTSNHENNSTIGTLTPILFYFYNMQKKPTNISPEETALKTQPREKRHKPVDLSGIALGMENSFRNTAETGADLHIKQALEVSKNGKGNFLQNGEKNESKELSSMEQKLLRLKNRYRKPKEVGGRPNILERLDKKSLEEGEAPKITETAGELLANSIEKETGVKVDFEKRPPNGERAEKIHELLLFVDKHMDLLLLKYKNEKDNKKKADYRIKTLNKARLYFLNPTPNNDLTEEEWFEARRVRDDIKEIMKIEKNRKTEVDIKKDVVEENTERKVEAVNKIEKNITAVKPEKIKVVENPPKKEVPASKNSTPLKTRYEAAIERQDAIDRGEIVRKEFVMPEAKNENRSLLSEEKLSVMKELEKTSDIGKILSLLEKIDGLQGKQKWFSNRSLIGRINLALAGELTPDYIPVLGEINLREKVKNFVENGNISITKPEEFLQSDTKEPETKKEPEVAPSTTKKPEINIPLPITEEALVPTKREREEDEKNFREGVSKLFNDEIEKRLAQVSTSRVEFGKQLKIKTQHEHAQSRLRGLISKLLGKGFVKKNLPNEEALKKAEDEYKINLDNLRQTLNDEALQEQSILKSGYPRDNKLEIVREEKEKLNNKILKLILVDEANLIQGLKEEGLSKKDLETMRVFRALAKKSKAVGGDFWWAVNEITNNNSKDNA